MYMPIDSDTTKHTRVSYASRNGAGAFALGLVFSLVPVRVYGEGMGCIFNSATRSLSLCGIIRNVFEPFGTVMTQSYADSPGEAGTAGFRKTLMFIGKLYSICDRPAVCLAYVIDTA